jgi:hypothetical protein
MTNILENLLEINITNMKQDDLPEDQTLKYEETLKQAIEDKFLTPSKFSLEIENIVITQKCNYIDAIVLFCEIHNLEVDSVSKLISKPLKDRLKYDAIRLNFMKQTSRAKLPI